MDIHYDPKVDMLTIRLSRRQGKDAEEVAPDVVLDYDENDVVFSIEIEHASKHADLAEITVSVDQWAQPSRPARAKETRQ